MSDSLPSRIPRVEPTGQVGEILLVDDSDFERFAIRAAVEGLTNFRICGEACNGVEAIEKAAKLKPDLVIMDLAMPLMNGLEAAAVLNSAIPKTPIVLLTLYADELKGVRAPSSGVAAVLSKANGLVPLLECLERFLGSANTSPKHP